LKYHSPAASFWTSTRGIVGVEHARLLGVLEFDVVAAGAERRHQAVLEPEALAANMRLLMSFIVWVFARAREA
jgi:hypothetical protein